MTLTNKLKKFLDFVIMCHEGQERKYNEGAYWTHPYAVAQRVAKFGLGEVAIAIALGHDLIEDCEGVIKSTVRLYALKSGFNSDEAGQIADGVEELTDVFTKEAYPELNRKARKKLEAERLGTISYLSQSVKYADLLENTPSITNNDIKFAKVYVPEKIEILQHMDKGHPVLFEECTDAVNRAEEKLKRINSDF
jgi:(p)ppGpp synthase/HD superfamily hydrolase